ncbi:MAG: type IX secretion system membrane protein PorP/SprF, partial [Bacteroidales bacterium]|nr:type IX secretion system membrane protein PorP/SprF [Bacteroidales bacterium]
MLVFISAVNNCLYSQQPTLISQYMFSNMAFNPAYAGNSGGICATGLVRQQWIGFKDADGSKTAPQGYMLTIDAPIKVLHGGVGGSVYQDQLGFFKDIVVKLGYAYRMDAGPGDLSIGLQLALQNGSYDFSKFNPVDENDPILSGESGKSGDMIFDANAGFFYKVPDKYYIGLSAENLLQSQGKT